MKDRLEELVERYVPEMVEWRQHFHRHPELSRQEFATADYIEARLREMGLEPRRVDGTGLACDIQGQGPVESTGEDAGSGSGGASGPHLILRGDMDALQIQEVTDLPFRSENAGVMHACGHDLHTAALLGAAKALSENPELFRGTVRLIFQHAEEVGYGGRQFKEAGLYEGFDYGFGMHVSSRVPLGKVGIQNGGVMASVDHIDVQVHGRGGHVGSPHQSVDALVIASEMVCALQQVVSRQADPLQPLVLGIGRLEAGTAYNIVAQDARFQGTLRSFDPATRQAAVDHIDRMVTNMAAAHGATAQFTRTDFCDAVINDDGVVDRMRGFVREQFGDDALVTDFAPSMAGDDFAVIASSMPACYAFVGFADPTRPETCRPVHTEDVAIPSDPLRTMLSLHLGFVLRHQAV